MPGTAFRAVGLETTILYEKKLGKNSIYYFSLFSYISERHINNIVISERCNERLWSYFATRLH